MLTQMAQYIAPDSMSRLKSFSIREPPSFVTRYPLIRLRDCLERSLLVMQGLRFGFTQYHALQATRSVAKVFVLRDKTQLATPKEMPSNKVPGIPGSMVSTPYEDMDRQL